MKKNFIFLSLVLVVALLCAFAVANPAVSKKNVYATQTSKPYSQHIIVVGKGEVEAEPDTIKVSFGLKCRGESLLSGQAKMRESINNVVNKIKEYNKDVEVYTNYMSSYPVFENGIFAYEFDCCLVAKTNDVKNKNEFIDAIVEAGATNIHNTTFLLTNKEEAYINALVKAKENAENKVKAIYENASLVGLKEEASYNFCEGSCCEKIKITAKVNAFYELPITETVNEIQNENSLQNKTLNNSVKKEKQPKISSQPEKAFETSKDAVIANNTQNNLTNKLKKEEFKTNKEEKLENSGTLANTTQESSSNLENLTEDETSLELNNKSSLENNGAEDNLENKSEVKNSDNFSVKHEKQLNKKENNNTTNTTVNKGTEKSSQTTKTNKITNSSGETRKIIDADGNVVLELF